MLFSDGILVKDINAPRVHNRALTGFLRRKWSRNPHELQRIIYNTDASPYLGVLPPELRKRVNNQNLSSVTAEFREKLESFLVKNAFDLREMECDREYDIPELGDIFGLKCKLIARGVNVYGVNPWGGACGFVCKLSFPEINAHYALKLYHNGTSEFMNYSHGAWFEVATALAANHAEPRDNVPMYMASLKYDKYMLSAWAGDREDGVAQRENKNKIFFTKTDEDEARNRRGGRRIDWGETYKSNYGAMSYPARKFYRQVMSMDECAVKKTIASARDNCARRDINNALKLADLTACYDDNEKLAHFIKNISHTR
ncbi:MAG: hypothetical protein II208_00610 [Alphaproteobacteria bacterium]|nr:hypothetical protein [Alphaproteobacteria bacterium]